MAKRKINQFDKWFKAQFGRLPEDFRSSGEMHDELRSLKDAIGKVEREINWSNRVEIEYRAASYSKNAAQKKFKF